MGVMRQWLHDQRVAGGTDGSNCFGTGSRVDLLHDAVNMILDGELAPK
jgi:hypothetical protein